MNEIKLNRPVNLQLFADGVGTAGGTATGETGTAAVSNTGGKANPLANVQYGIQKETGDAQVTDVQTTENPAVDANARFEELIKGEFKEQYNQRVQDTVQKRLKASKETVDKFNALAPTLEMLGKKYGVDATDIDALSKAIQDDDAYYEEEALEKGITVEQLKEILADYRKRAEEKQQAIIDRYQESRKKATEGRHKTEMRNKIKKVVSELNQYLLHGTKDKHVMIGMQKAVAEALSIVNMDTVGADDRVARYDALIAEATDPDVIESLTASRDRIKGQGDRLSEKLTSLQTAYSNIKDSTDPLVANAYDDVIEAKIASVAETVGDTPLRDMSMSQLESV